MTASHSGGRQTIAPPEPRRAGERHRVQGQEAAEHHLPGPLLDGHLVMAAFFVPVACGLGRIVAAIVPGARTVFVHGRRGRRSGGRRRGGR